MSETESKSDDRFYTPRAQASTARSTGSYGTPRSYRSSSIASSSSDGEYATPRNSAYHYQRQQILYHHQQQYQQQHFIGNNINASRPDRRNLIPPHHYHHSNQDFIQERSPSNYRQTNHFRFDQEEVEQKGDEEENLGQGNHRSVVGIGGGVNDTSNFHHSSQLIQPSKKDIESIFSFTRHGRIDEVDNLLKRGVPPDIKDENGNSILAIACQNGNKRLAKLALRHNTNINASNLRGNTALHFCYKYGNVELGQYLISKGADKTIKNIDGQMCEDLLHPMTF